MKKSRHAPLSDHRRVHVSRSHGARPSHCDTTRLCHTRPQEFSLKDGYVRILHSMTTLVSKTLRENTVGSDMRFMGMKTRGGIVDVLVVVQRELHFGLISD